jgi:hypothetical protein
MFIFSWATIPNYSRIPLLQPFSKIPSSGQPSNEELLSSSSLVFGRSAQRYLQRRSTTPVQGARILFYER